jgi:hypothetical protein
LELHQAKRAFLLFNTDQYLEKTIRPLLLVSVRNVITQLELSVGLKKVKSKFGNDIWEVKDKKFNPFDNLAK